MAKTVEQRVQELHDGVTWSVAGVWGSETAPFKKELDGPDFKSKGDIAGLAGRFDTIQTKFTQNIDKKDKAKEIFDKGDAELDKNEKQWDAVFKRLGELAGESEASTHRTAGDKVEDVLKNWEEMLKSSQGQTKESKSVYDQLTKLDESYDKSMADMIAKARKEMDAAKAIMTSANTDLNNLEGQIRSAVINYSNVATSKNKPEIAKAVKGVLKVFGGK